MSTRRSAAGTGRPSTRRLNRAEAPPGLRSRTGAAAPSDTAAAPAPDAESACSAPRLAPGSAPAAQERLRHRRDRSPHCSTLMPKPQCRPPPSGGRQRRALAWAGESRSLYEPANASGPEDGKRAAFLRHRSATRPVVSERSASHFRRTAVSGRSGRGHSALRWAGLPVSSLADVCRG
jgi:hypothetical protein